MGNSSTDARGSKISSAFAFASKTASGKYVGLPAIHGDQHTPNQRTMREPIRVCAIGVITADYQRLDSTRLDPTQLDSTRLNSTRLDSTRLAGSCPLEENVRSMRNAQEDGRWKGKETKRNGHGFVVVCSEHIIHSCCYD